MKHFLKSNIALFLVKVAVIYLLWYLIYELWLLPDGRLDAWLAGNIVEASHGILALSGYEVYAAGRLIGIGESAGILLVDGCTGISAIGLFLGFVFAYPGGWLPRIAFSFFGIGVIYLVNIARTVVLAITQAGSPEVFDFTHDYSTTAIFYIVIFILWMIWANYGEDSPPKTDIPST